MDSSTFQFLRDISIIYFSGVVFTFIAGWIWNNFTAIQYHIEPRASLFSWLVPFLTVGAVLFLSFSYIATTVQLRLNLSTRYQSFRRWYRRDDVKQ